MGEGSRRRLVATCRVDAHAHASAHELATHAAIARQLALLIGGEYVDETDPRLRAAAPRTVYRVPNDTIVGAAAAEALGVGCRADLFGGVVPHAFVATKAITHPLATPDARAPQGWSAAFAQRVQAVTLDGVTAFTAADARAAGRRLLSQGPVRFKPVAGTGGRGQQVVADAKALDRAIDAVEPGSLDAPTACGVVLEQNLSDLVTFSVGQVEVGGLVASYHGTQRLTRDNRGEDGYGGSTLVVARGGFEALAGLPMSDDERQAVALACRYDEAADACFAGFYASRRNYDVVVGRDARGERRGGVLEQSWRVGGASPAEVAALVALRADPARTMVRAGCVEVFGAGASPPPGATVVFQGVDPQAGALLKYAWSEPVVDP